MQGDPHTFTHIQASLCLRVPCRFGRWQGRSFESHMEKNPCLFLNDTASRRFYESFDLSHLPIDSVLSVLNILLAKGSLHYHAPHNLTLGEIHIYMGHILSTAHVFAPPQAVSQEVTAARQCGSALCAPAQVHILSEQRKAQ